MDYYSDQPGPTNEAAIEELIKEMGNEAIVREIMTKEIIGSWTGWYCSHKREMKIKILKNVLLKGITLDYNGPKYKENNNENEKEINKEL